MIKGGRYTIHSVFEGEEDPMVKWLFENTANQSIDNAAKLTEKNRLGLFNQ